MLRTLVSFITKTNIAACSQQWLDSCSKIENARFPNFFALRRTGRGLLASETPGSSAGHNQAGRVPVAIGRGKADASAAIDSGSARPGLPIQLHETRARPRRRR